MKIESFVDPVFSEELSKIANKTLEEIIKDMKYHKIDRLYITKNNFPVYVINHVEIIDIFLSNKLSLNLEEYIGEKKNIEIIDANRHIIDTYNFLRKKRIEYAPVVKNDSLIGEINFATLSLKISFIAIKDPLTHTYNQKYFNVLIEEYNEISRDVGIIMIKIENLSIYEGIYGIDVVNKILVNVADLIRHSIRDVDFLFRNDDTFKILTFNNAEITMKIKERIQKRLENLKVNELQIPFRIVATHVPEISSNILLAVEELENKLIKWD